MNDKTSRPLPFNTGKVQIGIAYQRPFRWIPSQDAYDLQTALIDGPRWVRLPWWKRAVLVFLGER